MKTEAEARAAGEAAQQTLPKGWKLEVWQNVGWHWALTKGNITVWGEDGKFHCLVGDAGKTHSGGPWSTRQTHKTAAEAIRAEVQALRQYKHDQVERLDKAITEATIAEKGVG